MADTKIKDYIKEGIKKGYSTSQLRDILLKNRVPKEDIDMAIGSLNSKKSNKGIFVFIWIAMIIVIALIAILVFNFIASSGRIDKETLNLVNERNDECKASNPESSREDCSDMAYFSIGILKADKRLCDYIKSSGINEECVNTIK